MKLFQKLSLLSFLVFSSSCAMLFNDKEVDLSINSNPPGADVFIDGKHYGKTPAVLKIEPKDYKVVLNKEGYGSTQLNLEYWVTMRNKNCVADAIGTMLIVPYYSLYWSGKCTDFKKKDHFVTIPRTAGSASKRGNSMIGIGNNPASMIDYYYNSDMMKHGSSDYRSNYQNVYSVPQN